MQLASNMQLAGNGKPAAVISTSHLRRETKR